MDSTLSSHERLVLQEPERIKELKNPSEELQRFAVLANPELIQYLPFAPENIQELAISRQPS
jgi:hypothetical protein